MGDVPKVTAPNPAAISRILARDGLGKSTSTAGGMLWTSGFVARRRPWDGRVEVRHQTAYSGGDVDIDEELREIEQALYGYAASLEEEGYAVERENDKIIVRDRVEYRRGEIPA